jgi:type II secretory pathway pseudopilin PulG
MIKHVFTIIELMIVAAVISILLSLLIPSLSRARAVSARTVCSSNLRQVGILAGLPHENQLKN